MTRNIALAALCGAALFALSACESAAQLHADDEAACTGYGFQAGTPDFAQCMQRQSLAREYATTPQLGFGLGLGFGNAWW